MMMEPPASIPRKRRRPALSCVPCRQRKVRCDHDDPCGPCVHSRSSLQLVCFYDNDSRPSGTSTRSHSLDHPLARKEASRSLSSNDGELEIADGSASRSQRSINDLQQRVFQLEELVSRSVNTQRNPATPSERQHLSSIETSPQSVGLQPPKAPLPRLRSSVDKTKIFAANNWIHTAEQFQFLGNFILEDGGFSYHCSGRDELTHILRECINFRRAARKHRFSETTLPPTDLASSFPPKIKCDELVHKYMKTFEPVYRIFHLPSFWAEYEHFWKDPQSVPYRFVVKLALVFAIGSVFCATQKDASRNEEFIRSWIYAGQWWLVGPSDFASLSIDGIQVGCLLILSRLTGPLSTPLWISTGSLLQMAMMMGLHRDTALFPSLTPFQVEMRNRLWVTVMELSTQSLLDSAVPFPLSLEEFDSRSPSNINDEEISPKSNRHIHPRADEVFTDSSIQILLRKSIAARLEIARLLNDPLRKSLTFERAMQLGQEVRTACREVSAFFQLHTSNSQGQNSARIEFHRRFLDMYLHRYLLFLHRPFMIEARKDHRYYISRKICIESCIVMASHNEKLDLASEQNYDDLSRLICVGSGTFKGALCMDVIAVLGLELVTQVEEESSTRTSSAPRSATDPLSELARANRAPLMQCLERIRLQLEQIIIAGRPSLKRYTFLVGLLALVRAIDFGLPIKETVFEDIIACLKKCRSYLSAHAADMSHLEEAENLPNDAGDIPDPSLLFPISGMDPNFDVDLSDFLMLPNLLGTSGMGTGW